MDSNTESPRKNADSPDAEKLAAGHTPASADASPPSSADPELPKLLIVKRTGSPGAGTGGSPWRRNAMQTTTIRAAALLPKSLLEAETPPPVPEARSGLRLQQRPPPPPPTNTRGAAKGPPKPRLRIVPNLLLTHIAAGALTIALIALATATVFLTLYKELTPDPLWHSLVVWAVVALFAFVVASNVKACQFFSVVITLLAILAVVVIVALEFLSLGPAPEMLGPWLPPLWRAVTVVLLGTASVTVVSGQTWLRYVVAVVLSAAAFWLLSSYSLRAAHSPGATAAVTPPRPPTALTVAAADFHFSLPDSWVSSTPGKDADRDTHTFTNADGSVRLSITSKPPAANTLAAEAMAKIVETVMQAKTGHGENCLVADMPGRAGARRITVLTSESVSEIVLIPGKDKIFLLHFSGTRSGLQAERPALDHIVRSFQPR